MNKLLLGTATSVLAFAFTSQSFAQLDEIVVTATKREAGIQDVPIAVTAFSGQQLQRVGINDVSALQTISPTFNLNSSDTESQGTTMRIRGVGTTGNNIGLESAVGVFVDGVYLSRPGVALSEFIDIDQVEVLRGPQGTLFGRNTSAGALNIKTKAPLLSEIEAWGNVTYGNRDQIAIQAGANLPVINDKVAVRVAGAWRERDAFQENVSVGDDGQSVDRYIVRGQALWQINENASLRIIGDYSDADNNSSGGIIIEETPLVAAGAFAAAGLSGPAGVFASGVDAFENRTLTSNGPHRNPYEQWGISGELNWEIGPVNMTYIGAYRDFRADGAPTDTDFTSLDIFVVDRRLDDIETQTHELRFQGTLGNLDWLVGGFYGKEDIVEDAILSNGADATENASANLFFGAIIPTFSTLPGATQAAISGIPLATGGTYGDVLTAADPALAFAGGVDSDGAFANNLFEQNGRSWAIFTHNTYTLSDVFEVVGGLRYIREEKDGRYRQLDASNQACTNARLNTGSLAAGLGVTNPLFPLFAASGAFTCFPFAEAVTGLPGAPEEFDEEFADNAITGTVKLAVNFNEDINGYFSFTHGYKTGGFNLDVTAAIGGASPQFQAETVNAYEVGLKSDLFNNRVRANVALFHQVMDDFQVLEFTGVQFQTFNVAEAMSTGAEFELLANPFDGLNLLASVAYADARYPDDCDGGSGIPQVTSLCGSRLTNAALWTGVVGIGYDTAIPNTNLTAFINTNVRVESRRRTSTQPVDVDTLVPLAFDFQEGNTKVNLRAGISHAEGRYAIEVWGDNVTDKQTRNVTFNTPLRGIGAFGTASRGAFTEAPRTFGVTVRARY